MHQCEKKNQKQLVRMCVFVHIDHQTNVNEVQTSDPKMHDTLTHSITLTKKAKRKKVTNSIELNAATMQNLVLEIS